MAILVIDDEESFARILRQHLAAAGYEVVCAATGAEGLAMAHEHAPDLILLDVRLPDMDGREVFRQLRTRASVPIIILQRWGRNRTLSRDCTPGPMITWSSRSASRSFWPALEAAAAQGAPRDLSTAF